MSDSEWNVERLISLLALAETATSTEEYLIQTAAATKLKRQHPELETLHADDPRVLQRIAEYRE